MKKFSIALLFLFNLAAFPASAADAPASDASIKQLIEITNSKKMLDGLMPQMDAMMKSSMQQALAGNKMTAEQEAVVLEMQKELATLLKNEMTWETIEPMFLEIYKKSFTQKEIEGMLSFYQSPAGQAVIKKMPLVMQMTMQMMERRMAVMMPKLEKISAESVEKLKKVSEQPKG
ncbi:DUF2059 domain-containing protein [Undibacterium flavidum]|uniref:DUF2059 domain-containing protein n=1 Tax=Undibacterium flavidum TaxID=2762297 RepID=A0ABR6YF01_9BURK|nr:DUF2059 domain-containing protein [Undibacterium flavidum]MBC3875154.1 DUF2059 domain-containing protein [Undibacterium flavidum]